MMLNTRKPRFGLLLALVCLGALVWAAVACGIGTDEQNQTSTEEIETMTTEQTDPCEGSTSSAYIHQVRLRNDPLFWRQPNVHGVGEGYLLDENGEEWTETRGIAVYVTERVDQSTLRTEDRIPDCIEGVPVRLIEMPQIIIEPEEFDGPND